MAHQQRKAFKDWFDRGAALALARQISRVYPAFDEKRFIRHCTRKLNSLEFNARVGQFADALAACLPDDYGKAIGIVKRSLPPKLPDCEAVTDGWLQWPVGQYIANHGQSHFDESMHAMVELTQRFSAEFAIRPFVEHQAEATFKFLSLNIDHPSPHVRRWCSEGTRTRLPWGKKLVSLIEDPSPVWPILEALKDDDELYVRRSVANSLNDLSKDHPGAVLALCKRWSKNNSSSTEWVIRHALRGMIKAGDAGALALIGFNKPEKITAELRISPTKIKIGESIALQLALKNTSARPQLLLVDYIVYYQGKQGSKRAKVFKWKTLKLAAGESAEIIKKHPMRLTTIRALYAGRHRVELQINGIVVASENFSLNL